MTEPHEMLVSMARAIIASQSGQRAADHAFEFHTLNEAAALNSARAALSSLLNLSDDVDAIGGERLKEFIRSDLDISASRIANNIFSAMINHIRGEGQ